MEQKKTVSIAKSVAAAVLLQSIKLQIGYLPPSPQFPGEATLRIQRVKSRYRLSPAKTSLQMERGLCNQLVNPEISGLRPTSGIKM